MNEITARLERLERENRVLKRLGVTAVVLCLAMLVMGQARGRRVVEAESFVLKDDSGKTRATLGVLEDNAILTIYGPQGGKVKGIMAEVGAGPTGAFLWLMDDQGVRRTILEPDSLTFRDKNANTKVRVGAGEEGAALAFFGADNSPDASIFGAGPDVGLRLRDTEGYQLNLGHTELVTRTTGERHKTSAASAVLFGKDGNVLWSAP